MENKTKKIKGSKKSKKNWKKTDITDVEELLENQRRDERIGVPTTTTSDDSLFFIDTKKDDNKLVKKKTSKVAANDNDDDDVEEEVYVSKKQKQKMRIEKEHDMEKRSSLHKKSIQNIWGQENVLVSDAYLEPTTKKKKKMPDTMKAGMTSEIEAVEVPPPGASYNPDYESHQDLLLAAHQKELASWKENKRLNEKVKMVSVVELKKLSKNWIKEMSEGLAGNRDKKTKEENNDDENNDVDDMSENLNNIERKTKKQKRLDKGLKKKIAIKDVEKIEKMKQHDLNRLKRLKSEIRKEEELSKEKMTLRQRKKRQLSVLRPKTLSKHKYKPAAVTVQLSEDLPGTLRELKPEGNLLEDRFKSLQKRNIIETRKRVIPHRKYKKKTFVKRSYKTDTIRDFKGKSS